MSTIGTNIGALYASFYLTQNNEALTNSQTKLASGSRLAVPSEDAAGVAVSAKMDATIQRLGAAEDGAQNVISFAQTSDGFLQTIQAQLNRMSELAQRATNGAFNSNDLANYNTEFDRIRTQISNIMYAATFNGTSIFSTSGPITVAINADGVTDNFSRVSITTMGQLGVDVTQITSISTTTYATSAISALQLALQTLTTNRAVVNADISKFQFHVNNLRVQDINIQAADSRIKDLDVADESTTLSKDNILLQAATSMLAQANSSQSTVLSLLK